MAGVSADIELVGAAVGAPDAAAAITTGISDQIDDVVAAVEGLDRPSVFYEIGYGPEIYGPAPDSFIADMVSLAGGEPMTIAISSPFVSTIVDGGSWVCWPST